MPLVKEGRIVTNIYRSAADRMTSIADKRSEVLDDGKVAITRFRTSGLYIRRQDLRRQKLSMVEFRPLTGRTHQIRVHAAEQLGTPIAGDLKYARSQITSGPLHLHSRRLVLQNYPVAGRRMTFQAPIPAHFIKTMEQFPLFLREKPRFPKKKLHNRSAVIRYI